MVLIPEQVVTVQLPGEVTAQLPDLDRIQEKDLLYSLLK